MCREATERPEFRRALDELSQFVVYEALRSLPATTIDIDTPLEPATGTMITDSSLFILVMRVGFGMLDVVLRLLFEVWVGFFGFKCNEEMFFFMFM